MVFFSNLNFLFCGSYFSFLLDWFHSYCCALLVFVLLFVFILLFFFYFTFFILKLNLGFVNLEILGCFIPSLVLVLQMYPSLMILFTLGLSNFDNNLSIKVIGHQWYWSYELGSGLDLVFDSYMKSLDDLFLGEYRNLEVDNRLIIPINTPIRFFLTSSDVIHSWSIPSFFIKSDVMPGLLTVFNFNFNLIGLFYGQCSEICGANHSFMPIVLEITLFDFFKNWLMLL